MSFHIVRVEGWVSLFFFFNEEGRNDVCFLKENEWGLAYSDGGEGLTVDGGVGWYGSEDGGALAYKWGRRSRVGVLVKK